MNNKVEKNIPPIVEIEGCDFSENDFTNGNQRWKILTLLREAKEQGCKEFDIPLALMDGIG